MKKTAALLILLAFSGIGCNNSPQGKFKIAPRRVTILTEPAGAKVTQINPLNQPATYLGTTPLEARSVTVVTQLTFKHMPYHETQRLLEQVNNVVVRIEKDGFEPYYGTLKTDPKETVVHTIQLISKDNTQN